MKKTIVTTTIVTAMALGILTRCKAYQKVEADTMAETVVVEPTSVPTIETIEKKTLAVRTDSSELDTTPTKKWEVAKEEIVTEEVNETKVTTNVAKTSTPKAQKSTTTQVAPTKETVAQQPTTQPTVVVEQPAPQQPAPQPVVEQPAPQQPAPQPVVEQPAPQPEPQQPEMSYEDWLASQPNADNFVEGNSDECRSYQEILEGKECP